MNTPDSPTVPAVTLPPPTWRDALDPTHCAPMSRSQWVTSLCEWVSADAMVAHSDAVALCYCHAMTPRACAAYLLAYHHAARLDCLPVPASLHYSPPPAV